MPLYKTVSVILFSVLPFTLFANSNLLVSASASTDGACYSAFTIENDMAWSGIDIMKADSPHDSSALQIFDTKTGAFKDTISNFRLKYQRTGTMNDRQVNLSPSFFKSTISSKQTDAILDFWNLAKLCLSQAINARHAIRVINDLCADYGYYGPGVSLTIAGPREVWLMEFVSKGEYEKGIVWVAQKLPEGYIGAHAGKARIGTFPLYDGSKSLYSNDLITFARRIEHFSNDDALFSFKKAFSADNDIITRADVIVWSLYSRVAPSEYLGSHESEKKQMKNLPLWIKPDHKLSLADIMALNRNHLEGTAFSYTNKQSGAPYSRANTQSTQQLAGTSNASTSFCGIAQLREWMPYPIGGLLWAGTDDSYFTYYQPIRCGAEFVPESLKPVKNQNAFSWQSQFWVSNILAHIGYHDYRGLKDMLVEKQELFEASIRKEQDYIDSTAAMLYIAQSDSARAYVAHYAEETSQKILHRQIQLIDSLNQRYKLPIPKEGENPWPFLSAWENSPFGQESKRE